jgi:hypothetical protein
VSGSTQIGNDLPNEEEQAREIFESFMQEHNVPSLKQDDSAAVFRVVGRCA